MASWRLGWEEGPFTEGKQPKCAEQRQEGAVLVHFRSEERREEKLDKGTGGEEREDGEVAHTEVDRQYMRQDWDDHSAKRGEDKEGSRNDKYNCTFEPSIRMGGHDGIMCDESEVLGLRRLSVWPALNRQCLHVTTGAPAFGCGEPTRELFLLGWLTNWLIVKC